MNARTVIFRDMVDKVYHCLDTVAKTDQLCYDTLYFPTCNFHFMARCNIRNKSLKATIYGLFKISQRQPECRSQE